MADNSPMELVHQIFVKLGARYIVVTDTDGLCMSFILVFLNRLMREMFADQGLIDKKTWLAFLSDLEEKS